MSETGGCSSRFRVALVVTINKDQRLALAVFASLDGDGDGCVTEAELRAAAEARDIELTEQQVQAFMALEADGDCVGLEAFLNSVDGSVEVSDGIPLGGGVGRLIFTC